MIDILLKYILGYEFFNALDAQSDFDKKIVTKKPVNSNHSYIKYALAESTKHYTKKNKKNCSLLIGPTTVMCSEPLVALKSHIFRHISKYRSRQYYESKVLHNTEVT